MPRSKLTHWLILLIRSLIVLIIVLLFARPVLHVGGAGEQGEENALAVVLIIDSSYSMRCQINGRTLFDRAQETAVRVIDRLKPADRAAVLIFSDQLDNPSPALIGDGIVLKNIVNEASPGYRTTQSIAGLSKAFELLSQSAATNKGIIFLTDTARHGWPKELKKHTDTLSHYDENVHLIIVDCSYDADNLFIENIHISPGGQSGSSSVSWQVKNPGNKKIAEKEIRLLIHGRSAAIRGFSIGPNSVSKGILPFSSSYDRVTPARIVLSADSLIEDNEFYFHLEGQKKISVLCVDGDPVMGTVRGETYFARIAFSGKKNTSSLAFSVINEDQLPGFDLSGYDVIMLCNVKTVPAEFQGSLQAFIKNGGGLVLFPGDRVKINTYQVLTEYLPVTFNDIKRDQKPPLHLSADLSPQGPFRFVADSASFELEKIEIESYFLLRPKVGSFVPLRMENGDPFMVIGRDETGRVAVFAIPIDRDWSNFPAKPAYVPLLRSLVRYCAGQEEQLLAGMFVVGQRIPIDLPSPQANVLSVTSMEGETVTYSRTGKRISVQAVDVPGHYQVHYSLNGKKESIHFAVNADRSAAEGDLHKMDSGGIEKIFPESTVTIIKNSPASVNEIIVALRGKEVTRSMAGILIVLLMLELVLVRYYQRYRKGSI